MNTEGKCQTNQDENNRLRDITWYETWGEGDIRERGTAGEA
jgi:hypothetical protein